MNYNLHLANFNDHESVYKEKEQKKKILSISKRCSKEKKSHIAHIHCNNKREKRDKSCINLC